MLIPVFFQKIGLIEIAVGNKSTFWKKVEPKYSFHFWLNLFPKG